MTAAQKGKSLLGKLYVQMLIAIITGAIAGVAFPAFSVTLAPIADGFIKLIKMLLAPLVFGTVVTGIARMGSIREVGRIGIKAIVYFEVLSTIALALGLLVINIVKPGVGLNLDPAALNTSSIAAYTGVKAQTVSGFLLNIIPTSMMDAFVSGAMLQVIFVSILLGIALTSMGKTGKPVVDIVDGLTQALFRIVGFIMYLAPLAAGAGIAFTIGKYGPAILVSLGQLIGAMYATALLFVFLVLGMILRWMGIGLLSFLRYIRDEILIVAATCSTEAVLPSMLRKLEAMGAEKSVVGMVLPSGYVFNADGTCLYLTGAAIFIAQATNTPLPLSGQIELLAILLLTSKGSAGVTGAGFVTLAATLSALHTVPVAGIVLILGVDRILNVPRALVNLIGNGVATIVVARWEGLFDSVKAAQTLNARA